MDDNSTLIGPSGDPRFPVLAPVPLAVGLSTLDDAATTPAVTDRVGSSSIVAFLANAESSVRTSDRAAVAVLSSSSTS